MTIINKQGKYSYLFILILGLFACQPADKDMKSFLYEPYPNVIFDMRNVHDGNRDIAKAFSAYEKGNFESAYILFDALDYEQKTPDIYFYTGMSLFADGKFQESAGPLRTGGKYGSQFADAARYYLIIADFERGKKENAFDRLKQLLYQNRMGTFTEKGQLLLEYLANDPSIPENLVED
jgi:hypothetical protein